MSDVLATNLMLTGLLLFFTFPLIFDTRKAEVLNSLVMKSTANENDTNDILQTFR